MGKKKNVFESREALCRCCGNIHTTYAKRQIEIQVTGIKSKGSNIDKKTDREIYKQIYLQKER